MSSGYNLMPPESYGDFFATWMSSLEDFLPLLLSASNYPIPLSQEHEESLCHLIADVTLHHKHYYAEKWSSSQAQDGGDVFLFFAMPWMTSLERAYSWITGWKPSTAFRIVKSLREGKVVHFSRAFGDFSEEQAWRIERLREAIRMEEDKVERDMERQQLALGDKKMVELVLMASSVKEGDEEASAEVGRKVDEAIKEIGLGTERVMKGGDCVRLRTLGGLMEALSPSQGVGFLGALTVVLLRMRDQGLKRSKVDSSVDGEPTTRA